MPAQSSLLGAHSLTEICIFLGCITVFLWLDLHAHRNDRPVAARDALLWSGIWVGLALGFMGYVWWQFGGEQAQLFLAGYLLEESLSVDNLFVIMAVFASFGVRDNMQHRVLYYGILGALVMRLLFVAAGTGLVRAFGPWALGVFGVFILWTAWKMWQATHEDKNRDIDYSRHWAVRAVRRFIPVHPHLQGHDFFVKAPNDAGKAIWKATPLFLCLLVVEASDVLFAFDSVPAIIAITQDPFLVYTSNIFAILGLRSLYFLLAAAKRYLCHLEKSVIAILVFIGVKMLLDVAGVLHLPPMLSLAVVAGFLVVGIGASLLYPVAGPTAEAGVDVATDAIVDDTSVDNPEK